MSFSPSLREPSRWSFEIDVDNRVYHHLSQSEIAGGKRISQHLFLFRFGPIFEAQVLTVIAASRTPLSQR